MDPTQLRVHCLQFVLQTDAPNAKSVENPFKDPSAWLECCFCKHPLILG